MSEPKPKRNQPFKTLGNQLRHWREQGEESLMEASGAVEIDTDELQRIEDGQERPSEDILLLLMQHYGIQESEAAELWDLAGYEVENGPESTKSNAFDHMSHQHKQMIMLLAMDLRTLYSDGADIVITPTGLTLSFTQSNGNKHTPISRIGMSYEQANELLKTLQSALLRADYLKHPKQLPPPRDDNRPSDSQQ